MSYGANRRIISCSACGHPLLAHAGGACHCGCRRAPIPRTGRRHGNFRTRVKATPTTLSFPLESGPAPAKPALEAFVEYVQYHLTEAEGVHLLARLADDRNVKVKIPKQNPWPQLREVAQHYPPDALRRFVRELKKRKDEGRWPVQPKRGRP